MHSIVRKGNMTNTKNTRSKAQKQNQTETPQKAKNTPAMSSSPPGASSSTTPVSSRKSTKRKTSNSSLSKISEAIDNLNTHLQSVDKEVDPQLAKAFTLLTEAVKEISKHLNDEDKLKRESDDEKDDMKQRGLRGKFVITSPKKGVDLVGDSAKYKNDNEVVKAVIDLAKEKYKVEIPEDEISTCYALKKGGIVLGLWRFGRGSAFQRLAGAIKSGRDVDKDMNVFFNFMLTKKRNNLLYNVRELKRKEESKIKKFYTDENGTITVLTAEGEKERITFTADSRRTISEEELISKFK